MRVDLSRTCESWVVASCHTLPIDIDSRGQSYHFRFASFLLLDDAVMPPPPLLGVWVWWQVLSPVHATTLVRCGVGELQQCAWRQCLSPPGVRVLHVTVCPCADMSAVGSTTTEKPRDNASAQCQKSTTSRPLFLCRIQTYEVWVIEPGDFF